MKLLIADDDRLSCRMMQLLLREWGYDVVTARDGQEACKMLHQQEELQLAILDWKMPKMDGVDVCRRIREERQEPYVYIMLLTGKGAKEDIVTGLEAGADDYLTKPFNPEELRVRIRAGRRIMELQSQLIAARESMREQATHDALTGLLNRAAVCDLLARELSRSRRDGSSLAVAMADLDHFKKINDTYGHMAGDAVLRETARRFRDVVRPYDRVARYGGEELLITMPGCTAVQAGKVAERVRENIAAAPIDTSEGMIGLTVSIGVAATEAVAHMTMSELVKAADDALYEAKRSGRNCMAIAAPCFDAKTMAQGMTPPASSEVGLSHGTK